MNLNKLTKSYLIVAVFFFVLPLQAQVTIGSNEEPIDGALLQMKTTPLVLDGSENATKGLAFPRVKLGLKDRLYPMFGTSDLTAVSSYDDAVKRAAVGKLHTGLVVYNTYESSGETDENKIFQEGLYVWLGDKWASVGTPSVKNGLTLTKAGAVELGGKLVNSDTKIELNSNSMTIATGGSPLYITDLEDITGNVRTMAVNTDTGLLGRTGVNPAVLTFVQSTTGTTMNPSEGQTGPTVSGVPSDGSASQVPDNSNRVPGKNQYTKNLTDSRLWKNLNWGKEVVVPFKKDDAANPAINDIIINNDLTEPVFDVSNPTQIIAFKLKGKYSVELSGYINYSPFGGATSEEVLLNLTIQIKKASETTWTDYSSVRAIMVSAQPWYRNTITLPPAIYEGEKDDEIRMIIQRPYSTVSISGTDRIQFLGGAHGGTSGGATIYTKVAIDVPWGTKFSSGLKITAVS